MNLKFIGTGSMENKNCNTSVMIDDILFDIGNGIIYNIDQFEISLSRINYLVITHFHGDHFSDITQFLKTRKIRGIKNKVVIIGPEGLKKKTIDLLLLLYGDGKKDGSNISLDYNIEFIELKDTQEYIINNKVLKAYKLEHGTNNEVLGYTYNGKIAYLVDTTLCKSLYELCGNIDYIIADVTNEETTTKHMGLKDYVKLAKEYKNTKFYAVHRGNYNIKGISVVNFPNDGDTLVIK